MEGGTSQQERRNVETVGGARRHMRTRDAQSRMNRRANYDDDDDDNDYDGSNNMLIIIIWKGKKFLHYMFIDAEVI